MNSRKIRYSLFILSFYSDQYNLTQAYMMGLAFYISLYIFVRHLKNEKDHQTATHQMTKLTFYIRSCSMCVHNGGRGRAMCFGRSFLPANVYTCAIFLMAVICTAEVSTRQHFLPCPALSCFLPSSWRAAGQDNNKKRVLSYRTGHQDRLSCAQL